MNTNFTYVMKDRLGIDFGGYTPFITGLFYIRMMSFQFGRCLHETVNNYSYSDFNVLLFFSCPPGPPIQCRYANHFCFMNA